MRVLVYGPMTGFSSYPVVMRGLCSAFEQLGLEVIKADLSGAGDLNGYDVKKLSVGVLPEGCPKLLFVMKPFPQMSRLVTEHGATLIGMHVGDVNKVPLEWKLILEHEEFVVVPSTWMQSVVQPETERPVVVSSHGVEPFYLDHEVLPVLQSTGPFRFMHFCSAGAYPERKGTPQVLQAFEKLGARVELTLIVAELRRPLKKLLGMLSPFARQRVSVSTRPYGISPDEMVRLYSEHHALVAPSRAEGFGCLPIESRALGVPVVQTICTGFSDGIWHVKSLKDAGIVKVPHRPLEPAWGDFGEAPGVDADDVANAMKTMIAEYPKLKAASREAASAMQRWAWPTVTLPLVERLRALDVVE